MNWIQSLYETYENCRSMIGITGNENQVPLLPICHTTQKVDVEITIDVMAKFRRARVLGKDEARTIIPSTEKSAGRTSGEAAHPLCDKLQYIAEKYQAWGGEKDPYWGSYSQLLSDWVSDGAPPKVQLVYKYITRNDVINDLVKYNILFIDKNDQLCNKRPYEKAKNAAIDIFDRLPGGVDLKTAKLKPWQADAFIRWNVEIGDPTSEVWNDPEIIQSWIDYYSSRKQVKAFCYVTGKEKYLADQHPAKIRNDADKAKLISSGKSVNKTGKTTIDDGCGFTFLGRFTDPDQVAAVGFETTQKAHLALRWLISRQGYVLWEKDNSMPKPGLAIVAWALSGAKPPQPTDDTWELLYGGMASDKSPSVDTAQETAVRLSKRIAGYGKEIGGTNSVVVMAVDSATPGRLSIVYYNFLTCSDFLQRIDRWHETCAWRHTYHFVENKNDKGKIEKHFIPFYGAPAPADIAEAAYAAKQNGKYELDAKLRKATIKRLLPCIVDGRPIPRDIVESVVRRASKRRASNKVGMERWQWEKTLSIACALYRKYREGKEEYTMALDEARTERDYLYGRLLAIADVLEERTLSKAEKNRPTNATRYMQQFSQRPFRTWKQIHESLIPYIMRQGENASYYKKLIGEVEALFAPEDFTCDSPLTGEYLLGFYCQRQKMWEKKESASAAEEKISRKS